MKILMVMEGFFPGKEYGGPPVSVDNFCSLLNEYECFIVTHNHDKSDNTEYKGIESCTWVERDNCSVMYLPDSKYSKQEFESIILSINPDIIYLQGLFQQCILPCLQLAKKHKKPVLLAPRGELCAGAFKKKYKKIPYVWFLRMSGLISNVSFQSTSDEETMAIARYLNVHISRIHLLTNIPSIPKKEYIRAKKEQGKAKFIFLSRIHPKKNLISAIKYLNIVDGNVSFDIYGPIEDNEYWNECKVEIQNLPDNIKVNYCGLVSHDEVHHIFSKYDAFIFPTFSENYGHVIAESLIVGTPVILGQGTTPWDDINGKAGFVSDLDKVQEFSRYLNSIVQMSENDYKKITESVIKYIEKRLKITELKWEYISVLEEMIGGD